MRSKIVIKPGHGSGGRGVQILDKDSHNFSTRLNRAAKDENYICMSYAPADTIKENLAYTVDAVAFLDSEHAQLNDNDILYTSRVFQGKKVNTISEGAGISPIMLSLDE
jgi:hypothetical protein